MIEFIENDNKLICIYTIEYPYSNFEDTLNSLEEKRLPIKNTFHITKQDIISVEDYDDDCIAFTIGELIDNYYLLNKDILNLTHDIYLDKTINITRDFKKYFIAYYNISIFSLIDDVISNDLYIDNDNNFVNNDNHIPFEIFKRLVSIFPNTYELKKYSYSRISQILSEYFDKTEQFKVNYEKYLNKKEKIIQSNLKYTPEILNIKLDLLKASYEKLSDMLLNFESYSEIDWQKNIKDIIGIIFPKYLYTLREVNIGIVNDKNKYPDFILIDSNGYIDIMEIKKPEKNQVMRNAMVRNNYVPQKIFTDVMVQCSKYILALNRNTDKVKENILSKLNEVNSSQSLNIDDIKINNPKAIVLFGRSNELNKEQLDDFELIKRQYKDITEIMTYDDLLNRIKQLISSLESQLA